MPETKRRLIEGKSLGTSYFLDLIRFNKRLNATATSPGSLLLLACRRKGKHMKRTAKTEEKSG